MVWAWTRRTEVEGKFQQWSRSLGLRQAELKKKKKVTGFCGGPRSLSVLLQNQRSFWLER